MGIHFGKIKKKITAADGKNEAIIYVTQTFFAESINLRLTSVAA